MHPLDYSESVPGGKPTTGRQAATSRGTSTGMHTVGCSRMCACQQCCTPLPYHKFVHTDLILQPVCLVAMGIAWCNDVALVQRRRTARVWIHPLLTPYWADATMHVRHTRCLPAMQCRILQWCCALGREKQARERAKMSPSRHRSLTQRGVLGRLSQSQAYACRGTKGTLASAIRPLRGSSTAGHLRRHNVHMTDPPGISAWYRKAASPLRDLFSGRGFCTRASALRRSTAGSAVVCSMPRLTLCQETGARRGGNSQGKDPEHAMGMSA